MKTQQIKLIGKLGLTKKNEPVLYDEDGEIFFLYPKEQNITNQELQKLCRQETKVEISTDDIQDLKCFFNKINKI